MLRALYKLNIYAFLKIFFKDKKVITLLFFLLNFALSDIIVPLY